MALYAPHLSQDTLLDLLIQRRTLPPLPLLPSLGINHNLILIVIRIILIVRIIIRHPVLPRSRLCGISLGARRFRLLVLAEG